MIKVLLGNLGLGSNDAFKACALLSSARRSMSCCFCRLQAAMDFVVEEDLKAHLTCWYIQKYVKENPQPRYFEHIYQ